MMNYNKQKYDLVITGGKVVDVINDKIIKRNIGVKNGKIACITTANIDGHSKINAKNHLISPGFIDFHSHIDGNEYSATCLVKQGGTTTLGGERNLNSKLIKGIVEDGFIINQGFSISHSFVLRNAVGISKNRTATLREINAMVDLATKFLEFGAYGICFGLELVPGISYEEILALAKVAQKYDRPILIHMRKDGLEALEHFDEIIKVAEETGVSIQILQLLYMVGIGGAMGPALDILDNARAKGLDITADSGLYKAFTVCIGTGVFDEGWEAGYGKTSVDDLLISSGIHMGRYCDESLFSELRRHYPETLVSAFVCDGDAIPMAIEKDYVYVSTNAADGPHYTGVGAPEVAGTYPRLLGRYVREEKILNLIEAIKKITILPARRFGLSEIGSIELNKNADIVIFDPDTIIDKADFVNSGTPDAAPEGIKYVLVNGKIVVIDSELTNNTKTGRLIKREVY